jgi:hypothetical protein
MPESGGATTGNTLSAALSRASFMQPEWYPPSAWIEHAPFAFWIVDALRPRTFVELGSHYGYSFFAVCQAVDELRLATKCTAIDTWQGDDHAGFYSDRVFQLVKAHAEAKYPSFSKLLRMTFDEALPEFDDRSVDLLHIDGRHYYDDVKHDYETWARKVSDRGIVLFHDTQVFNRGFGVHRLWDEIRSKYPSFEFHHGHGLGVLGVGDKLPQPLNDFFRAGRDEQAAQDIRAAYARLGSSLVEPARRARRSFSATWKDKARGLVRDFADQIGLRAAN